MKLKIFCALFVIIKYGVFVFYVFLFLCFILKQRFETAGLCSSAVGPGDALAKFLILILIRFGQN